MKYIKLFIPLYGVHYQTTLSPTERIDKVVLILLSFIVQSLYLILAIEVVLYIHNLCYL